jgi:hypothetical protein
MQHPKDCHLDVDVGLAEISALLTCRQIALVPLSSFHSRNLYARFSKNVEALVEKFRLSV